MAKTILDTSGSASLGATGIYYIALGVSNLISSLNTENLTQVIFRSAGVLSNLFFVVSVNTVNTSATTLRTRKNTANGNLTVSVNAATTGQFEDTANSDTIAAGDLLNYNCNVGSTTGSMTVNHMGVTFNATTNTVSRLVINSIGSNFSTASIPLYHSLAGIFSSTIEASTQFRFKTIGTLANLYVFVTANARTTTTTVGSRKNTAAGNLVVSIGAAATGAFEDTANSDSLVVDDKANYVVTTLTGTEILTISIIASEFTTNNKNWQSMIVTFTTVGLSVTANYAIGGKLLDATEVSVQQYKSRISFRLSNLECYLTANTITAASTLTVRKAAANTVVTLSIPASTSGYFEDITNKIMIAVADLINLQLVTGGTGTSLSIRICGFLGSGALLKDMLSGAIIPIAR